MSDKSAKELVKLLKRAKEHHQSFRFHLYGTIDVNLPEEFPNVDECVQYLQQYGDGKVIHVELLERKIK